MTTITLSTGIEIHLSTRKSNRSGYTGAALSTAWTLDESKPFIAACANPSDTSIRSQLYAQERTSWHGGYYADAREAAYVTELFKIDPINVDHWIHENGHWVDFPSDLYNAPKGLDKEEASKILKDIKLKSIKRNAGNVTVSSKLKIRVAFPTRSVNDNKGLWPQIYEKYDGKALFAKYGNDVVIRAKEYLTPQEFINLFNLED